MSDIGGILGLFLGFSVLTILEFVELLMDLCAVALAKLTNRKRKNSVATETNPSVLKVDDLTIKY